MYKYCLILLFIITAYARKDKLNVAYVTDLEVDDSAITDGISVGRCVWFVAEGSSQLISYCGRNRTQYYEIYTKSPDILTSDGDVIYFASSKSGQVGSFDISKCKAETLLYLGEASPSGLLVEGKYLYISLYDAQAIALYNTESGGINKRYELDYSPTDITEYAGDICVGSESGIRCYSDLDHDPDYIVKAKVTAFVPQFNRSLCYVDDDRNTIGCTRKYQKYGSEIYLGRNKGPVAAVGSGNELFIAEFDENAVAILDNCDIDEYHLFGRDNKPVYGTTGGPSALAFLPNGNLVVATWSQNKLFELYVNY